MGEPPSSGPEERAGAAAEGPAAGAAGGPPPGPVRRLPSSPAGAGGSPPPGATARGTSPPGAGDAAAKAGQGASGRGEAGGRTVGTPVPLMGGHSASSSQQRGQLPQRLRAVEGPAGGSTSMGSSETARRPARAHGAGEDWCWGWALGRAGSARDAHKHKRNNQRPMAPEHCTTSNAKKATVHHLRQNCPANQNVMASTQQT